MCEAFKKTNVLSCLMERESSTKWNRKRNQQLLRTVVCERSYKFRNVLAEPSVEATLVSREGVIVIDGGHLVYEGYGIDRCKPIKRVNNGLTHKKLADAVFVTHKHVSQPSGFSFGRLLYGVSTANTLIVLNLDTGSIVLETDLQNASGATFCTIEWMEEEETFIVSSSSMGVLQWGGSVIRTMAVFTVMPVSFVCMMDFTKDIFGSDVLEVTYSRDILTAHHFGKVCLYNFRALVEQCQDSPQSVRNMQEAAPGPAPAPLRSNVVLTQRPPCLQEVDSAVGFKMTLGNYVHNGDLLLNSSSLFVGSKYDRQKITPKSRVPDHQGVLVSMGAGDITGLFPDDLSSRLIVICGQKVHMLHLTNRERKQDLVHCFTIPFMLAQVLQNLEHEKESVSEVRRQLHVCQLRLEETSYNDSLGVLMVTGTLTVGELMGGVVSLYDDSTGRHLRSVLLEPLSNKYTCQTMKMQGDTIVRILEFHETDIQEVQVYRLSSH